VANVLPEKTGSLQALALPTGRRLARGMSWHTSSAMLVFAVWQTWLAASFAHVAGGAILPWAALTLLIIGAIPIARRLERRWYRLAVEAFPCPGLIKAYRRDRMQVWSLAVLAPPLWLTSAWVLARLAAAL
jgi:hypothetical protein